MYMLFFVLCQYNSRIIEKLSNTQLFHEVHKKNVFLTKYPIQKIITRIETAVSPPDRGGVLK